MKEAWFAVLLLVVGCVGPMAPERRAEPGEGTPAPPKRIVAAIQGDPVTVAYRVQSGIASQTPGVDTIEVMVAAGLVVLDGRGVVRPQLAEEVPSLENGQWRVFPDGRMETAWKLREGARWHDGTALTSDDLVFTTAVGRDREIPVFGHVGYAAVEGVEAPDSRTVLVRWSRPFIGADSMFSSFGEFALPLPRHLLESAYLTDKASFPLLPYWHEAFVGSGPYRVREWERGSHVVLQAFEAYPLGRPRIDEVVVRFILDQNALVAAVLAGEVELTLGKTISLEQALILGEQWTTGRVENGLANWLVIYPQFLNPSPPVVLSVDFRRSLMHATDRQQIVDSLMGGATAVAETFVNLAEPEWREVEPSIVRYPLDLQRSSQLLEGLGYRRGLDGWFLDEAGRPLKVELRTDAGNDLFRKTLLAVADFWQRAGVGVDQVLVPPQRQRDREYAATFPGFSLTRNPSDLRRLTGYHSSNAHVPENDYRAPGGVNRARYVNPEFDALIERYQATIPVGERMDLARRVVRHMTDQVTAMGLFYDVEPTLISNRLVNVTARIKRSAQSWNTHQWDVR